MSLDRWLPPLLVGLVCAVEAWTLASDAARPVAILRAESLAARPPLPAVPPPDAVAADPAWPAFAGGTTADDVARGVWALAPRPEGQRGDKATEPPRSLVLTDAQRAALAPLLRDGAEARRALGEARAARRAAETALLEDATALAVTLGPRRARAVAR